MRKFIVLLILLSCKENKKIKVNQSAPVKINNYDNKLFVKDNTNSKYLLTLQGYDLGDSRYISSFDEKNDNIKLLYKKNNLKDFNSLKTFKSIKGDTLYTFPLSEQNPNKLFVKDYKNNILHNFYLTIYFDKIYGQVIIIDSIR
ncbi:hypothetical protein [Epilithonimonas caeni]|uniref:hypothetical protein n=1 Tax=Epilithonimonas caeni TaxID=365343 RepID=UPI0003F55BA4|nr:hypothetical protein [Epilithonimonas caeni]